MGNRDEMQQRREEFIQPLGRYRGPFSPQQLAFNANIQEFAYRVSLLCGLETSGKLSAEDTYQQIKQLWATLKRSKQELLDAAAEPPHQDD